MLEMIHKPHQKDLRHGRYVERGLYYFITTNIQGPEKIFLHTQAAKIVLDTLKWVNDNQRITLIAAMVMPDHLHFVMELKDESLSKIMHSLKSFTANEINKVLGRSGQLWGRARRVRPQQSTRFGKEKRTIKIGDGFTFMLGWMKQRRKPRISLTTPSPLAGEGGDGG